MWLQGAVQQGNQRTTGQPFLMLTWAATDSYFHWADLLNILQINQLNNFVCSMSENLTKNANHNCPAPIFFQPRDQKIQFTV